VTSDLAGIIGVLVDVERRADELNRRAAELVDDWVGLFCSVHQ